MADQALRKRYAEALLLCIIAIQLPEFAGWFAKYGVDGSMAYLMLDELGKAVLFLVIGLWVNRIFWWFTLWHVLQAMDELLTQNLWADGRREYVALAVLLFVVIRHLWIASK